MTIAAARIRSLDLVRGVAVMGILLMNIQSFAMPEAAYLNPAAYGGDRGADLATWCAEYLLVDGKMRGLFSCLFGASLLLVVERAEAAGRSAAATHYRRMGWLFVIGLAHLILVWDGDILTHYALVGAIAYLFRHKPAHALVAAALALLVAQAVVAIGAPLAIDQAVSEMASGHAGAAAMRDVAALRDQFGASSPEQVAASIALHRGPFAALVASRLAEAPRLLRGTLQFVGFETLAYMLLGMAALKSGMLSGESPRAAYRRGARIGLGAGALLTAPLAVWIVASGFDLRAVAWAAMVIGAPARVAMIGGWACLILALAPKLGRLGDRIAAAGRMALSNYLATSLICAGLFDRLGLFGRFSRVELLAVVAAIWALMLLWSTPWLARLRYGPFEWLWRSLARGRPQSLRGAAR